MKIYKVIEWLISKIKKEKHELNYKFSFGEVVLILFGRLCSMLRGYLFIKPFLNKSGGLVFADRGVEVLFASKIQCGRNLNLQSFASINALSQKGIIIGDNFTLGRHSMIECTGVLRNVGLSINIGDNVGINHYCYIGVRGNITIGNNVIFGPRY